MPEAVIVATARSPIGRAGKGSLKDVRPDDLTLQMVQAALAKVPALDPNDIDDLMIGCGQPAGESGFNLARVVAVLAAILVPVLQSVLRSRSATGDLSNMRLTMVDFATFAASNRDVIVNPGLPTDPASAWFYAPDTGTRRAWSWYYGLTSAWPRVLARAMAGSRQTAEKRMNRPSEPHTTKRSKPVRVAPAAPATT